MPEKVDTREFRPLKVAIIGGGIGGMSAAVALRRAGHICSVYERRDFDVEVGASLSCAANGNRWLHEWGVDVQAGRPVDLQHLLMRDWHTGEVRNDYDLSGYAKEWGTPYYMFHRRDQLQITHDAAVAKEGEGTPVQVVTDHIATHVDHEAGVVTFENGEKVKADLVLGADGIRSKVREAIGIVAEKKSAPQTCYRVNVSKEKVEALGLDWAADPAIQFWGGYPKNNLSQYYKVVMSPMAGYSLISFYLFMPTEMTNHHEEGFVFAEADLRDVLAGQYSELDPRCVALIKESVERKPWRLYIHQPYKYIVKGRAALVGDSAHPMMPHQSQGACQAVEDAAALGLVFSKKYGGRFTSDVEAGLRMYEKIRHPRATRVQEASKRALENLNERIGFTSLSAPEAALAAKSDKLTVDEMNNYDMHKHVDDEVAKLVQAS